MLSEGFRTKIRGGYWYSSSRGFTALLRIITSGSTMNTPQMPMRINSAALPAVDRFNFFFPDFRFIFRWIFASRFCRRISSCSAVSSTGFLCSQAGSNRLFFAFSIPVIHLPF